MTAVPKLLVVSPTPTHPPSAGNRARILSMVEAFAKMGIEVHFVHLARDPADDDAMRAYWGERYTKVKYQWPPKTAAANWGRWGRMTRRLRAWLTGDTYSVYNWDLDDWYNDHLDGVVRELHAREHFDAVLAEYVFLSRVLLDFPDTLKIIDTHDVFADRFQQFLDNNEKPVFFSTSPKQEGRGLDRADVVIAIQEAEAAHYRRITRAKVITVGHLLPVGASQSAPNAAHVLFVGSPNSVNVHGAQFFMTEVMPLLRERIPEAKLVLAGRVCENLEDAGDCVKLGALDDLDEAYAQADVVVNPRKFGTGLSIKSIEALAHGKPLVATRPGCSGMEDGIGTAFLLAEDAPAFADAVARILEDHALYARLSEAGIAYARKHNDANLAELKGVLAPLWESKD
ncbi:MAG: glycosyltransferase family 4 protein [Candidatus Hydrogenedentota bacterium]